MDSENSSKKSPVDFLYSGLEDVLAEVNLKILEMAIVILSLWELCHEKDQSLTPAHRGMEINPPVHTLTPSQPIGGIVPGGRQRRRRYSGPVLSIRR